MLVCRRKKYRFYNNICCWLPLFSTINIHIQNSDSEDQYYNSSASKLKKVFIKISIRPVLMALFSSFFGCFMDSTSRIAVEGNDKFVAVTACTLDSTKKNCEFISYGKSGDISKMSDNRGSEGSPVLVPYFPIGSRYSYL